MNTLINNKAMDQFIKVYKQSSLKEQYILQDLLEDFIMMQSGDQKGNHALSIKTLPLQNNLGNISTIFEFVIQDVLKSNTNKSIVLFIAEKEFCHSSQKIQNIKEITEEEFWSYRKIAISILCDFGFLQEVDWEKIKIEKNEEYDKVRSLLLQTEEEFQKGASLYPQSTQDPYIKFFLVNLEEIKTLHEFLVKNEGKSQNIKHIPIFLENEGKLVYGEKEIKFRENSQIYTILQGLFSMPANKYLYYEDIFDHALSWKKSNKKGSDLISKYSGIFKENLKLVDFFGTGSGFCYRKK